MILNYDPSWTATEASEASEREQSETGKSFADPTLPIFRWNAHHELEALRRQHEGGHKTALFAAIRECANHDMPLPLWASKAFIHGYDRVVDGHANSWDDAFGRPHPKGVHLAAYRKRRKLRFLVWKKIRDILNREPETPIDEALFEKVGDEVGAGKTLVSDLYYKTKAMLGVPQRYDGLLEPYKIKDHIPPGSAKS